MSQDPDVTTLGDIWSVLDESRPLTKREQFAMAALPAAMAGQREMMKAIESDIADAVKKDSGGDPEKALEIMQGLVGQIAKGAAASAVMQADALIAALDGEESVE